MPRKDAVSPTQERLLIWLHVHDGDAFGTWTNAYEYLRPSWISEATMIKLEGLGLTVRTPGAWGFYHLTDAGKLRVSTLIDKGALVPPTT